MLERKLVRVVTPAAVRAGSARRDWRSVSERARRPAAPALAGPADAEVRPAWRGTGDSDPAGWQGNRFRQGLPGARARGSRRWRGATGSPATATAQAARHTAA